MDDGQPRREGAILPLYDNPGHLARRLHQIAVSIFVEMTRDSDMTPVQYSALVAASNHPGIDQRTLSRAIAYDRSTIGDVVARLEKKGLLRRQEGRNGRTKAITITAAGRSVLDGMAAAVEGSQEALLAPLSEGERFIFLYLLRKLVDLNNELSRVPQSLDDGRP